MKQLLIFLFALMIYSTSVVAQTADPVWIDVRTSEEYAESAIPGHTNIPHTEIADKIATLVTNKDTPVYLYCVSGRRAGLAREELQRLGYSNVTNFGTIDTAQRCVRQLIAC
jgi:phage shock protein E